MAKKEKFSIDKIGKIIYNQVVTKVCYLFWGISSVG